MSAVARLSTLAMLASLALVACRGTTPDVPTWERPGLYGAVRPEMGAPQPGDPAPDFELPGPGGEGTFRFASLRGSWVVLHFTASWCPFCDAEVSHLGELASAYAGRGVRVVLVDVKEDAERWSEYSKAHVAANVVALRDAEGSAAERYAPPHAQPSFTDRAAVVLDSTLIVDPEGKIRLFLLPDSKHFDPTFTAVKGELDRFLGTPTASAAAAATADDVPALTPEQVVAFEARAPREEIAPGAHGEVVLPMHIASGYHVMSDRPSAPEYIATHVHLDDAAGLAWGAPRYPPSVDFMLGKDAIATFRGDVEVRIPVDVAADAAPGPRVVPGTLRYQSCTEHSCLFPITRRFEVTVRVGPGR